MAAERRGATPTQPNTESEVVNGSALTVLPDARPTPITMEYRCEGCGRRVSSTLVDGPRGWRRVRLTPSEDPANLCTRCVLIVSRAIEVAQTVAKRRGAGRGKQH
jgi:hypothetical protein